MLKDILAVSGKPGLYKLVSRGSNLSVIESITDKKRMPAYSRDAMVSIGNVLIFTNDGQVSVSEILTLIKEKEENKNISFDVAKAMPDELRGYLAEIVPNFDRDRVYPNEIKKLLKWYDLLISCGITDFSMKEEGEISEDEAITAESKTTEESSQTTASSKLSQAAKSTSGKRASTVKPSKSTGPKPMPKSAPPKKSVVGAKRGS